MTIKPSLTLLLSLLSTPGCYGEDVVAIAQPDNCPSIANPDQTDDSGNGIGNACRVVSAVECVDDLGGGAFRAHFGYRNPEIISRSIPISLAIQQNVFEPAPADRGQPTVFLPGRQRDVFTAMSAGGNLVWWLDTATATASLAAARCP